MEKELTGDDVGIIYDFIRDKFGWTGAGALQLMADLLNRGDAGRWTLAEMVKAADRLKDEG